MNYHEVHCTNCGKIIGADRMAVDLDELLKVHMEKMARKSSDAVYQEAQELFREIKIGMYLTKYELVNEKLINLEDSIALSFEDIRSFMERRYQITLPQKPDDFETNVQQADRFWEEFDQDIPQDIPQESDSGTSGKMDVERVLDELSLRISFYHQIDNDEAKKRDYIRRLLELLVVHASETALECDCVFLLQQDDRGQEFISSLRVTYVDGEVVAYNHMVCPHCGNHFFIDAGKYEERVIVMLGSSRVGKTAYLAALVEEINPLYGQSKYPNIVIRDTVDRQYTNFKNNILTQYRQGKKIVKTDESKDEVALFPLEIVLNGQTIIFTFVDLPGEVFVPRDEQEKEEGAASGRFIINHRKICYCADAFWFCIDPVQIDIRLHDLNSHIDKADQVEMDMDIVLSNIENVVSMMGVTKSKLPTAVLVTKSDRVDLGERLYSDTRDIGLECLHEQEHFRTDIFKETSERVKKYLTSGNVKNIVPKLDQMFEFKSYFSVAAYGKNVEKDSEETAKAPYGISLPFLWTTACMGFLQPVKLVQKIERKGMLKKQENVVQYFDNAETGELYTR